MPGVPRSRIRLIVYLNLLLSIACGGNFTGYAQTQPQVSYAVMTTDPASGVAVGTALYSLLNSRGVLLSEAGFGAVAPSSFGRLFVDEEGATRTGVAIVNPSASAVTVRLTLRNAAGVQTAQRSDVFGPNEHRSLFVDELFAGLQNFTGSLTFQTDTAGVAVVAVRMDTNYAAEPLITTIAVTDLNSPLSGSTVLPHLAAGDGLSTQIILMNPSNQAAAGVIRLFADDGSAIQFILNGSAGSTFAYNIPAQGAFSAQLTQSGPIRVGWAEAAPNAGSPAMPGMVVFQYTLSAGLLSEAGITTGPLTRAARIFVDQANTRTGVAIANPSANSTSLTLSLLDRNGGFIQSANRSLPTKGHAAFFADEVFPGLASGFTGLLEIDSTEGAAVVALRVTTNSRRHTLLATLPVADLTRIQPTAFLVFPQIAFGYFGSVLFTTRAILINEDMVTAASGSVQYFQENGAALNQPLGCSGNVFSYRISPGGVTDAQRPCWPPFLSFARAPTDQPVISSGKAGSPMAALDPFVLKDPEGYHIFFTSAFCKKGTDYYFSWDPDNPASCDMFDSIGATAYAFSNDQGLTWQIRARPVFYPGASGEWDSRKVETPNLVRVNNRLFLFYCADMIGFEQRFQLGVTSIDLAGGSIRNTFLVSDSVFPRPTGPLIPFETSRQAFTNNVQEPAVVYNNGRFEVYFTGLELQLPNQPISAAGQAIRFVGLGRRVFDDQLRLVEQRDTPLLDWVNIPEVRLVANLYFLFSTTLEPSEFHQNEKLEYRTSLDGLSWSNPIPVLGPGAPLSFDNWGVAAPTAQPETNSFIVFYMAFGEEDHPCSTQPGGRLGTPVANGQKCVYNSIGRATGSFR